ncbi:glycosyltransferase family 4 protein [Candidatus Woesearchaeota archaeon]|nr:glycosyltransferase family 4 protein [Candidatus Woesearchaeota archaeon]
MKICYVNPTVLLKRPVAEISSRLAKDKDNEIGLLVPKKLFQDVDESLHYSNITRKLSRGGNGGKVRLYTYSVIPLPFISSEWPIPITPMFFVQLFRVLKRYDIIHLWVPFYISSMFLLVCKGLFFRKKKLILTMDTIPGYSFSMGLFLDFLFRWWYRLKGRIVFRIPNVIHLYGQSMVPFARQAGIPMSKIKIIPTGIDLNAFSGTDKSHFRHSERVRIRQQLGIAQKEVMILFVGLLVPRKGIDTLILTMHELKHHQLKDKHTIAASKMIIVGDGPCREHYQRMVTKLQLNDTIIFTGWRKDVHNLYKAADIFFFPSKGEGLPGVIMEAMASGLPIVASKIPGNEDLVKNKVNGFLCPQDPKEYASALQHLLHDQEKQRSYGQHSRERIQGFDWSDIILEWKKMYKTT